MLVYLDMDRSFVRRTDHVKSLAKSDEPKGVSDFRPITIFGLLYRAWSSIHSRHWLRSLAPLLDEHVYGNRPGTRASSLWMLILHKFEESFHSGVGLQGLVLDLTKAYNTLPRIPVFATAVRAGMTSPTLVAWSGALGTMVRHFAVRGSYSPGLTSSCGFPEGCGLSCVAMLLVDHLFSLWLRCSQGSPIALSYVDNWEILVSDPALVESAFQSSLAFAHALDLTIDADKTYCWSTNSNHRSLLRSAGQVVKHLGAHVVYCRKISNSTIGARVASLDLFWVQLRTAWGSIAQKLQLVRQVAWPRAFHAISSAVFGKKRLEPLRSKTLEAVGLQKPGASPLMPSAWRSSVRILFASLHSTFRDFRDLCHQPEHVVVLDQVCRGVP